MKKLLSILTSVGLVAAIGTTVISCGQNSPQLEIKINKTPINLFIGQKTEIKIENFQELQNLQVSSDSPDYVDAFINEQKNLEITSLNKGHGGIIISASNAETVWIQVTINPLKHIQIEQGFCEIYEKENAIMPILNFNELDEIKVSNEDNSIAQTSYNPKTGEIFILGIKDGFTQLKITARDSETQTINVKVFQLKKIVLDQTTVFIEQTKTAIVKVTNIEEENLENISVLNNNPNLIQTNFDLKTGTIQITGINVGTASITIKADHAIENSIQVQIDKALKEIVVDFESVVVESNNENKVLITNFQELGNNITVTSDNEKIVTTKLVKTEKATIIMIYAHKILKQTSIRINADEAREKVIKVNVIGVKIQLNKEESWIFGNEIKTVQINNLDNLVNPKIRAGSEGKSKIVEAKLDSTTGIITLKKTEFCPIPTWTLIYITADNAQEKTFKVTVCNLTYLISKENITPIIKELAVDDQLNFSIKKGTKIEELPSILNKQFRQILSKNHYNSQFIKKIIFNDQPSQEDLEKIGWWNSNPFATIDFEFKNETINIQCQYFIDVTA